MQPLEEYKERSREELIKEYDKIAKDCVITTASCSNYAPYLFNMLVSLHKNFPGHPPVYVFDLGMKKRHLKELSRVSWISLKEVPRLTPYWRLCYTWKPLIWDNVQERYVLHLDAGLIVLKPLESWFLVLKERGYILFDQGGTVSDATPPDYLKKLQLDDSIKDETMFGAGVIGFDKAGPAGYAIREASKLAADGWTLGYSKDERWKSSGQEDDITRECQLFRHDQTVINLTMRKNIKKEICIHSEEYAPCKRNHINPKSYLWHARKTDLRLLRFLWEPLSGISCDYFVNRMEFTIKAPITTFKQPGIALKRRFFK